MTFLGNPESCKKKNRKEEKLIKYWVIDTFEYDGLADIRRFSTTTFLNSRFHASKLDLSETTIEISIMLA